MQGLDSMQTEYSAIGDFVSCKRLALVGVSRNRVKFGHIAYRELKARGYVVYPINRLAGSIDGEKAYADLADLPEHPEAVVLVTPPAQTESVLQQCTALGIRRVWLQQGAESETAIQYCSQNDMVFVARQCILMYAPPVRSHHLLHRWLWRLLGKVKEAETA